MTIGGRFMTIGPFMSALRKCSYETLCVQDMQILVGMWILFGCLGLACIAQFGNK